MIVRHRRTARRIVVAAILTFAGTAAMLAPGALAEERPIKESLASHIGWEADKTTGATVCTTPSKDECQPATRTNETGGFQFASGIAINDDSASSHYHDIYVADLLTARVQELSETGQFLRTFGWDVNKTKTQQREAEEAKHEAVTVSQAEQNVCTAASHDVCQPGTHGSGIEHVNEINLKIAVDPANGNVYISEVIELSPGSYGARIQELTSDGEFIQEIGEKVNETTSGSRCTATEIRLEGVQCGAPAKGAGVAKPEAFDDPLVLTFGPSDTLYVGEAGRVQELSSGGSYEGELSLKPTGSGQSESVVAMAVDNAGDAYVVLEDEGGNIHNVVYELSAGDALLHSFVVEPREAQAMLSITSIALDSAGRLGISEYEANTKIVPHVYNYRGRLYGVGGGRLRLITEFTDLPSTTLTGSKENGVHALAFNDRDELVGSDFYATSETSTHDELLSYVPVPVAELTTGAAPCVQGVVSGSDVTVDCSLGATVNPWEVAWTNGWFQWGLTPLLGQETPVQIICTATCSKTPSALSAGVSNLRPNETVYFRVVGDDANVQPPELLTGEETSFQTPTVAPRVVGTPGASFVKSFSANLTGTVNAENTSSEYLFEYAPAGESAATLNERCPRGVRVETCAGVGSTEVLSSSEYGKIAVTLEASGLAPATTYMYRLNARNADGEAAGDENGVEPVPEGAFTTLPVLGPKATTGGAAAVGTTTATIFGVADPEGQPATYEFELGLYDGVDTRFGIVAMGSAASGGGAVQESADLEGLQPGVTYAYRITVTSANGTVARGDTGQFMTASLPSAIEVVPAIGPLQFSHPPFPGGPCKKGFRLNGHGKCVAVRKKKTTHRKNKRSQKKK